MSLLGVASVVASDLGLTLVYIISAPVMKNYYKSTYRLGGCDRCQSGSREAGTCS
jgi:hypothetical protein